MRPYFQATEQEKTAVRSAITQALGGHPGVILAFLFGSFVDQAQFRDIDVAVVVDHVQIPPAAEFEFVCEVATDLELRIHRPVDLMVLNHAPIALRYYATRGELLVCTDEETRSRFLEETWRDYFYFEPFLRKSLKDLLEG